MTKSRTIKDLLKLKPVAPPPVAGTSWARRLVGRTGEHTHET